MSKDRTIRILANSDEATHIQVKTGGQNRGEPLPIQNEDGARLVRLTHEKNDEGIFTAEAVKITDGGVLSLGNPCTWLAVGETKIESAICDNGVVEFTVFRPTSQLSPYSVSFGYNKDDNGVIRGKYGLVSSCTTTEKADGVIYRFTVPLPELNPESTSRTPCIIQFENTRFGRISLGDTIFIYAD